MANLAVKVGDKLHVRDKKDSQFYRCTVVSIDNEKIKIHFIGWNKKHDEWFRLDSCRIRVEGASAGSCLQNSSPSSRGSFVATLDAFGAGGASAADVVDVFRRRNSLQLRDGNLQDGVTISGKVDQRRNRSHEGMSGVDGGQDVYEGAGQKTSSGKNLCSL